MKRTSENLDTVFDKVAAEIRNQTAEKSDVDAAAERVLVRLSHQLSASDQQPGASEASPPAHVTQIQGCADFQALIPAYLSGSLSEARRLLVEDHTHECVPCRKALKAARSGGAVPGFAPAERKASPRLVKWGVAAAVVLGIGIVSLFSYERLSRSTSALRGIVESINGPVYRVSDSHISEIGKGQEFKTTEHIRTGKGAGAVVKLPDGSLVEMRERSELSLSETAEGLTINLARGNVIVQAAKQREQHLFVRTADCLVSVTGTIFSVNNGTKGSRVSVIEGEVHVDHSGEKNILSPGDQVVTSPSIEPVPVNYEIAWSRDADRYTRLLAELTALRKELDMRVSRPGVRYSTRLLDLTPSDAVLYVAIPNLSAMISESNRVIEERVNQNPVLRQWWDKEQSAARGEPGLGHIIEEIGRFGGYLGDEIVVTAQAERHGPGGFLVMAELRDPDGFRGYLDQQLQSLKGGKGDGGIRMIDNPLAPELQVKNRDGIYVWIQGNLLSAAPDAESLKQLALRRSGSSAAGSSAGSAFKSRIAEVYQDGAGLLVAADLEKILEQPSNHRDEQTMKQLGLSSLKYLIFEMKDKEGKAYNQAVLSFNEERRGITAWLAEPGPMGALQFISPDANLVAAFVVKEPAALVDDLINGLSTIEPGVKNHLKHFEDESGLNITRDFAAPLGGEFAFAIDGPLLPKPSWKMVLEVYDPSHLQSTYERLIEQLNTALANEGKRGFEWEKNEAGGLTFYTLKSLDQGLELSYVYIDGYMVIGPSRALVDRAVRYREAGYSLLHSPRFIASLPEDKNANFSAFVYQNLTPLIDPLAKKIGALAPTAEQQLALKSFADAVPVLAYAYAYDDRIIFSLNGEEGPLGLSPSSLLAMPGGLGLHNIFDKGLNRLPRGVDRDLRSFEQPPEKNR